MDIEQLKLILEMVGAAGEGAKDLALVFVAVGFAKGLVAPIATVTIFVIAAGLVRYGVDKNCVFELEKIRAKRLVDLNYYRLHYPHTSRGDAEAALGVTKDEKDVGE